MGPQNCQKALILLELLVLAFPTLPSRPLVKAQDEQASVTNLADAFRDYDDEFYVYTPFESAIQSPSSLANAENNSSAETIGQYEPAQSPSMGVDGKSALPSGAQLASAQASLHSDVSNGQRNSNSLRDNSDEPTAATTTESKTALLVTERRRPYCIGHKESGPTFSWTCRGPQMVRVPSDLKPKPTSFSIEGAPSLTTFEANAFANMTRLRVVYVFQAPRLISFNFAIMGEHPELKIIRIQQTGLVAWPDLSRFEQKKILSSVDLDNNKIETLGSKPLNIRTELLNLEFNRIQNIDEHTFNGSEIGTLSLFGNRQLVYIHHNAFVNLKNLIKLDLSGTSVAQLPPVGWQNLRTLKIRDNYALKQIPSIYAFPQLEEAHLTYAYHCCSFRYPQTHNPAAYEQHRRLQEELNAYCGSTRKHNNGKAPEPRPGAQPEEQYTTQGDSLDDLGQFQATVTLASNLILVRRPSESAAAGGQDSSARQAAVATNKLELNGEGGLLASNSPYTSSVLEIGPLNSTQIDCDELVQKATELPNISCTPEPDAFNPCEDIMGYPVLRVAVWFVVAASVLGNMSVIVVHLGIFKRLSVPKFLQLNLAIGDLFMGVYLAMLAAADLTTKGTYFNFAIDWQHGLGCRLAGASSLFASQLSIFTLSVITFERYYTITYSIDLNMRLQLGWASRIMLVGWLFAMSFAMLPIFANINSYSKTSICLPMRASYKSDRAFILILLIVDLLAFLIIFICYLKMYLLILRQKSEATRKERTVATRMALLVFTDFACWAPIVFFGTTAVLGHPLISVTNSKILIVFFYPLNSMANPFLYVLTTRQYRRDLNYVIGRWRQWRKSLFKKTKDELNFSYNNQLHRQPYGLSQYPVGAQLNAHLGAVAAVTGVAKHLRHYKVPINGNQATNNNNNECTNDFEVIKSGLGNNNAAAANLLETSGPSESAQQKRVEQKASNQGSARAHYIIRHTILADKCALGDERTCGLGQRTINNKHRVHRALKQRAQLVSAKQAKPASCNTLNPGRQSFASGALKMDYLSLDKAHKQTNEPTVISVEENKSEQKASSDCNKNSPNNCLDRTIAPARHIRCCCCRARVKQLQAGGSQCHELRTQSDNGGCERARKSRSRAAESRLPTNRRRSSSGPNEASSSQVTGEPVSSTTTRTTTTTDTNTDKNAEITSTSEQVAHGIIPRIITTENGVEFAEQTGSGALCACCTNQPASSNVKRKQSSDSLATCAHRTPHAKRRHQRPREQLADRVSSNEQEPSDSVGRQYEHSCRGRRHRRHHYQHHRHRDASACNHTRHCYPKCCHFDGEKKERPGGLVTLSSSLLN